MKFALPPGSEPLLRHTAFPVRLRRSHSIHLPVLLHLSLFLSQSASPPSPASFIETVKVKTNPIDQPAHRQMDAGSHYW